MTLSIEVRLKHLRLITNSIHWIFEGDFSYIFRPALLPRQADVLNGVPADLHKQIRYFHDEGEIPVADKPAPDSGVFDLLTIEVGEPYRCRRLHVQMPAETFRWMTRAVGSYYSEQQFSLHELWAITLLSGDEALGFWKALRLICNETVTGPYPNPDIMPDWDGGVIEWES